MKGPLGHAGMFAGLVLGMTCTEGKRFLRICAIELCAEFINDLGDALTLWELACQRWSRVRQPVAQMTHRHRGQARSHRYCVQCPPTTMCVNGETYACNVTSPPTSTASTIEWKNT
ncbi:hypothetical protein PkP19E3_16615 [Pseudomonas koreensis]|nr:hypothetical protein PkP19E3_16615 [Pseudomonas koreensis]